MLFQSAFLKLYTERGGFLFTIGFIDVVTESMSWSLSPIGGQTVWRCTKPG